MDRLKMSFFIDWWKFVVSGEILKEVESDKINIEFFVSLSSYLIWISFTLKEAPTIKSEKEVKRKNLEL